jgi:hypothetical protein
MPRLPQSVVPASPLACLLLSDVYLEFLVLLILSVQRALSVCLSIIKCTVSAISCMPRSGCSVCLCLSVCLSVYPQVLSSAFSCIPSPGRSVCIPMCDCHPTGRTLA